MRRRLHLKWPTYTGSKRTSVGKRRQSASVIVSAHEVAARREARVELVERVEEPAERALVGALRAREAGAVDAVVDVLVDELVELVDLGAQLLGQVVELRLLGEGVELAVEHADDLARLVVDDAAALAIPEHRHRHVAVEVRRSLRT